MPIADTLLPEFDQEMANTRKTLERCPEDKFSWKPHPKSFSLGMLATHLATMPEWGVDTIKKDSLDIAPPDAPPFKMEEITSQKELVAQFDKHAGAMRTALAGASDEHLLTPWTLLAAGQPIFTMPRIAVIKGMIINHSIHHRGQLTVYLRLNEVPVPALYGPSADEQA
jgi:uncharacterized damage-inducible protein DinB